MTIKERVMLGLKGFSMGLADIIPGVSGGTMALILGIYTQLIDTVRSVNLSLLTAFLKALKGGFKAEARADLMACLEEMRIGWLITLVVGIVIAVGIGSRIIPTLMERYPEIMRALFLGLILASIALPIKMMETRKAPQIAVGLIALVASFVLVGNTFTPPLDWTTVEAADIESGGQTLKSMAEAGPSALTPEEIYRHERNGALREALAASGALDLAQGVDPKAKDNPYNTLVVPAGTTVDVPRPALWFILIAGFVAISAMLLPGLSGSYILLVFGTYYFMLNALKGFLRALFKIQWPGSQAAYVVIFIVGMVAGVAAFSRVLAWLLRKYPSVTLAALAGVMVGCLRTIWPFKVTLGVHATDKVNVLPSDFGSGQACAAAIEGSASCWSNGTVIGVVVALLGGMGLVIALSLLARRSESQSEAADVAPAR